MKRLAIYTLAALSLIASGTTAEVNSPYCGSLVWELGQDPISDEGVHAAVVDIYYSQLDEGQLCYIDPSWRPIVQELVTELSEEIYTHHQDQIDWLLVLAIIQELVNEVDIEGDEGFEFRLEGDR